MLCQRPAFLPTFVKDLHFLYTFLYLSDVEVDITAEATTVSEDKGVLQICAEMTGCCPVQPEFAIPFTTTGTAGSNYISENQLH